MLSHSKIFSLERYINILHLALKLVNVGKEGTVDFRVDIRYKSTRLHDYTSISLYDFGKGVTHTKRNHEKLENISPCNLRNCHGVVCAILFSPG